MPTIDQQISKKIDAAVSARVEPEVRRQVGPEVRRQLADERFNREYYGGPSYWSGTDNRIHPHDAGRVARELERFLLRATPEELRRGFKFALEVPLRNFDTCGLAYRRVEVQIW